MKIDRYLFDVVSYYGMLSHLNLRVCLQYKAHYFSKIKKYYKRNSRTRIRIYYKGTNVTNFFSLVEIIESRKRGNHLTT